MLAISKYPFIPGMVGKTLSIGTQIDIATKYFMDFLIMLHHIWWSLTKGSSPYCKNQSQKLSTNLTIEPTWKKPLSKTYNKCDHRGILK
jgi:hypothetical protein